MNYAKEHNICPADITLPVLCDTLVLDERIHLVQIAEVLDIDLSVLESLNPQYRKDIIPGNGVPYTLCLPQTHINTFLKRKDDIIAYRADELNKNRIIVEPAAADPSYYKTKKGGTVRTTYKVKQGDTLYSIARKQGVGVEQLRKLNNLPSNSVQVGQTLRIR